MSDVLCPEMDMQQKKIILIYEQTAFLQRMEDLTEK